MKKLSEVVAITGGCGRIGSALAEDLLKLDYKVLLGDVNKRKLLMFKKKMKSKNIEIFFGDLTVKRNIDNFISFGIDTPPKLEINFIFLIQLFTFLDTLFNKLKSSKIAVLKQTSTGL